jgi:ABC-type branched-subunit amino acid transport system substrate-binding protein
VVVNDVQFMGARDDLKPAITKLLAKPGEYIVMLHYQPTIGDAMKRLQSLPLTTPVTGFFEGLEESVNLEGRRFVSQFDTQPWFYEKFYRRYPKEKPIKAAFGYDLTMILGQTLHHTQRLPTSNEIITSLSRLHDYHGATGTISSNSRRNIETTCVRKIIKNGRAELINPARVNSEKNE